MTLLDFWKLARRYWMLAMGLPVLCLIVCLVAVSFFSNGSGYTATSNIFVNSQLYSVAGFAAYEANTIERENPDITATAKPDSSNMAIIVEVKGPNEGLVEESADEISKNAVKKAESLYAGTEESDYLLPFSAEIENPIVSQIKSERNAKYLLAALCGGLFLAICSLVLIDMKRKPVKGQKDAKRASDLLCLGELPSSDEGKLLFANVRFSTPASESHTYRWCIVPTKCIKDAQLVANVLEEAARKENLTLDIISSTDDILSVDPMVSVAVCCESLIESIDGAYCARRCDAAVLVIREWDSAKDVESTIQELSLAKANLIGFVYIGK